VTVDSTLRTVTARGTEDFIISVAQQISWLAAVCQEKQDQLTYAYVGFFEASHADPSGIPAFDVDAKLEIPSTQDSGSCWNTIVGPAVLVTGFPLPERNHNERGLEVSIPVMAALAETPKAVTFGDGFVFKSRCHALVPIEDLGFSIQWHLVDAYPEKLEWAHIDKACLTRLRRPVKESEFWSRRSFLGWCPQVLELLGKFSYALICRLIPSLMFLKQHQILTTHPHNTLRLESLLDGLSSKRYLLVSASGGPLLPRSRLARRMASKVHGQTTMRRFSTMLRARKSYYMTQRFPSTPQTTKVRLAGGNNI
jgi:hypothetical protein